MNVIKLFALLMVVLVGYLPYSVEDKLAFTKGNLSPSYIVFSLFWRSCFSDLLPAIRHTHSSQLSLSVSWACCRLQVATSLWGWIKQRCCFRLELEREVDNIFFVVVGIPNLDALFNEQRKVRPHSRLYFGVKFDPHKVNLESKTLSGVIHALWSTIIV